MSSLEAELLDAIMEELRGRIDTKDDAELSETARAIYRLLVSKGARTGEIAEPQDPYGDFEEPVKALAQIIEAEARSLDWQRDGEQRHDFRRWVGRQLVAAGYGPDEITRMVGGILDVLRHDPSD